MKELEMISKAEAKESALQMAEKTSYLWLAASALWSIVIYAATHNFWLSVLGLMCGAAVIMVVRYLNYGARFGFQENAPDEDDEPDD